MDEISLLDYWRVIWKRRRIVIYVFLVAVISTAIISLLMTPIYQAKATLMPVESSQGRFSAAREHCRIFLFSVGLWGGPWARPQRINLLPF